ncbi:CIC11C00000002527 [Sungouiella intermedia]|uniref:CIC11C00000002527 n=1 Tax=Sungouiella intermedia TaxID=45354 RepID=A0A1L0DWA3_9ASCO|nr:CIC11C00000002527 [[Candida] intermedia]
MSSTCCHLQNGNPNRFSSTEPIITDFAEVDADDEPPVWVWALRYTKLKLELLQNIRKIH